MSKYTIDGSLLRPYQLDIVKKIVSGEKKHLLLIHPRRSGKSVLSFYLVNALINKYWVKNGKPCNATVFAPFQNQSRSIYVENILADGRKLLEISNAKFIESRLSLEYPFGSRVKFSGSDRIDSSMGTGNSIIVLDEFALGKAESFDRLFPMIQNTLGNMIVISTPRGRNHMYDLYKKVYNDPEWLVVHSNVFDLGLMTQEEYNSIPMSTNLKQQEFLCSWDSPFDNAIYDEPTIAPLEQVNYAKTYIGIDLGIRDATAVVVAQLVNDGINILHSFETVNTSLTDVVQKIFNYTSEHNLSIDKMFVPHDTSQRDYITGQSRLDYLYSMNIPAELVTRNGIMDGINIVRGLWSNIVFNEGIDIIEHVKAYVTDKSTQLPKHNEHSHSADALRYLILGLQANENVEPYHIQYNNEVQFGKPRIPHHLETRWESGF